MRLPDDDCDHDRQWRSLEQLMTLRGIPADAQQSCYCCYESDASRRYALPAINHKELNGNEILAYRYYGKRLPQPSDDLYKLPPLPPQPSADACAPGDRVRSTLLPQPIVHPLGEVA
ncbi:hypothetical protein PPS11_25060 [Pseudomonas putida S11]|nr:hypothetical protein PPS11_25060 [Pseudomonas putida S11]